MYGAKAGKRPLKRPLRTLTVHEKLNAITRVISGKQTKASVARDIGVPESTLRGWCKNHEKISKQAATSPSSLEDTPESHHIRHAKRIKKNRAELARIGAELGLNRPEMLPPTLNSNNLPELTMALSQLNWYQHWYHLQQQALQQQIQTSTVGSPTDPNAPNNGLLTMDEREKMLPNIEQQRSVYDPVSFWLKQQTTMGLGNSSQQSTVALNPCLPSTSTMASAMVPNIEQQRSVYDSVSFWLKQQTIMGLGNSSQQSNMPLNPCLPSTSTMTSASTRSTITSAANYDHESIEHGLQFLRALEHCSHPSITMLQIYQFRDLMKNLQTRYNYKSSDSHK